MSQPRLIALRPGNTCDERLWLGGKGAIVKALGVDGDIRHADLSRDDSIAAMAARTLTAIPGPIVDIGSSLGRSSRSRCGRKHPSGSSVSCCSVITPPSICPSALRTVRASRPRHARTEWRDCSPRN